MGQGQTKPCEVRPSFEDNLIDMKLQQKQLEKMAKKSEK